MNSKSLATELLGQTRAKILESLLARDDTVSELSDNLHVIQPGVRKHLDYMEKIGIVTSFFRQSGLGRPKKYYKITSLGRSLFPKMYDQVLTLLISRLSKLHSGDEGSSLSEKLMSDIATNIASDFNSNTKSLALDERIQALESFLNSLGFSARITKRSDGTILILRNDCALYSAALNNYGSICVGFDLVLISKCLNVPNKVKMEHCMALGKRNCEHVVSLGEAD